MQGISTQFYLIFKRRKTLLESLIVFDGAGPFSGKKTGIQAQIRSFHPMLYLCTVTTIHYRSLVQQLKHMCLCLNNIFITSLSISDANFPLRESSHR